MGQLGTHWGRDWVSYTKHLCPVRSRGALDTSTFAFVGTCAAKERYLTQNHAIAKYGKPIVRASPGCRPLVTHLRAGRGKRPLVAKVELGRIHNAQVKRLGKTRPRA
eukprot:3562171-Amphidinium_carterae.1